MHYFILVSTFFLVMFSSPTLLADPPTKGKLCLETLEHPLPPSIRLEMLGKYLAQNPNSKHRDTILREIEKVTKEMRVLSDSLCQEILFEISLFKDMTLNPFSPIFFKKPKGPKTKTPSYQELEYQGGNFTLNPFFPTRNSSIPSLQKKSIPPHDISPDGKGTLNPFFFKK